MTPVATGHPTTADKKEEKKGEFGKTQRDILIEEREAKPEKDIYVVAHLPSDFDEPVNPEDREKKRLKMEEERLKKEAETAKKNEEKRKEAAKKKQDLLKKIGTILEEHNNNESEIPASSEYWALVNQYRTT